MVLPPLVVSRRWYRLIVDRAPGCPRSAHLPTLAPDPTDRVRSRPFFFGRTSRGGECSKRAYFSLELSRFRPLGAWMPVSPSVRSSSPSLSRWAGGALELCSSAGASPERSEIRRLFCGRGRMPTHRRIVWTPVLPTGKAPRSDGTAGCFVIGRPPSLHHT